MHSNNYNSKIAVFFDLDLTITNKDTFRYFVQTQLFNKMCNWHFIPFVIICGILRKFKIISLKTFKESALSFLKGKSKSYIQKEGVKFFENFLIDTIRKQAIEKIQWHKRLRHYVLLATASPDIYISSMAAYLCCDGFISSKLLYNNNKFTGKLQGQDCIGMMKKHIVENLCQQKKYDISKSYAYSDHQADIPLLEVVGNPVAISPTEELRRIAESRNWPIKDW